MPETVLNIQDLQVEFFIDGQSRIAVDGINLHLEQGQILGIVGESGSGKSVTSLAIMGLIDKPGKISGGKIFFTPAKSQQETVDLLSLAPEQWRDYRGGEIAMIFQEPMSSLNPVYNIGFQITEAIQLHQPNLTPKQAQDKAIALLQKVQLLPSDKALEEQFQLNRPSGQKFADYLAQQKQAILKRYPHQMSGGQLQRVMIAMAMSCNPTLLIADEPTTALDVTVQAEILRLLKDLCKSDQEMSLIFISHDLGVINEVADIVAVMYEGKVVEQASKDVILNQPQHPYTKGLLACRPHLNVLPVKLLTVPDYVQIARDGLGKITAISEKTPPLPRLISPEEEINRLADLEQQKSLLQVEHLSVLFPVKGVFGQVKNFFRAVDDVSFEVRKGETLGLVGESGCGKSTLARTLLRLIPLTQGTIHFSGENISQVSLSDARLRRLRREMQIVFQNPQNSLNPRLTIGEAILEPLLIHRTEENDRKRKERVTYLLERVNLDPRWFNRYPHQLSGGQRQRVCIARALALKPQFVICDESVSALDVSVQADVLNLFKELQKEFDLTYIFISHDLSIVRFMSDRILVMNRGKIEEMGTAAQVINQPQKPYTEKLIASIPQFTRGIF